MLVWLLSFVGGVGVGLLNGILTVLFVIGLDADTHLVGARSIWFKVFRSIALRLGLVALVFLITVQWGWGAALSAFVGVWITRWLVVLWVQRR